VSETPSSGSCTEPDPDDAIEYDDSLDYLAARLINGRLGGVGVEKAVDLRRIEAAVREILIAIGEDPDRDGLRRTPARVASAYAELFAGLRVDPAQVLTTTFEANHEELVLVRDIEVMSLCEHHLLPFHGVAHIGYIPGVDGRITGLSKLARLVEVFARRPQVQERLTSQIADLLMKQLEPRGVIAILECEHMCMAMRGIQKGGARTITSAVRGLLRDDAKSRAEAMSLILR
jgi:GTP cyclohydrolase I